MNSLLAEQVTLDQAAELMAVSSRHARRMLTARICAIYDRSESRPSSRLSCRSMPSHAGMLKLGKVERVLSVTPLGLQTKLKSHCKRVLASR